MGSITAVAVWDHAPSARELLDRRLALGWTPTPSLLQTGARVLGYAACAVTGSPHRSSGPRPIGKTRPEAGGTP